MGQIQQMCSAQIDQFDSSIGDSRNITKQNVRITNPTLQYLHEQTDSITETINELKQHENKSEDKENYEVETNITQIESLQKQDNINMSFKRIIEITEFNEENSSNEFSNRSKSWSLQLGAFDYQPKSILKKRETHPDLQETRNSSQQKKVRFSVKDFKKKQIPTKYKTYKKISFL